MSWVLSGLSVDGEGVVGLCVTCSVIGDGDIIVLSPLLVVRQPDSVDLGAGTRSMAFHTERNRSHLPRHNASRIVISYGETSSFEGMM